ncbi:MAG TPA: hypothetical protein VFC56_20590 [Stellaceae bacterium]|nr:hypothetical protein [Stellaceae bacterium]
MKRIVTAAIAAAVFAALGGAAKAERVCQWFGEGWVCRDGSVITDRYPAPTSPNIEVNPAPAPQMPPGQLVPNVYGMERR